MTQLASYVCCLAALFCSSITAAAETPDVVLHHGKIITVDKPFSIAEAMAIKGDRIVAVGKNAIIKKLAGPETKHIDLQGKTVLPGLIDSHTHPTGAAMYEFDHQVPEMRTIADVLRYIKSRVDVLDDGEWISLSQVFITRLRDQRFPTRKDLDSVAPKNPVLFRTGPDAALNSLALKLSGIDRNTKVQGKGYIEKDPKTGEPTGILRSCTRLAKYRSPKGRKKSTTKLRAERLRRLLADYNKVGITSISDRSASDGAIALYKQLKDDGRLTCRVYLYYSVNAGSSLKSIEARIKKGAASPLHKYDNMLWLRGVKIFLDGGMLTGSAYMRKPWGISQIYSITDPKYRGLLFVEPEKLYRIAKMTLANGLQMTAHSVGDGAVHALIKAYEEVHKDSPIVGKRPCITHCNFMSRDAIARMKKLGIVADLQPAWLYLDGATLRKQFGDKRMTYFQPYKSCFESGVVVGGGSDHMQKIGGMRSVNPYNPFWGMWITLTRQPRWIDTPLHAEQRITREQAIRLYTINNAFLTFEEKEKGSLEPGKLADFIVIDRDILKCPVEDVQKIQVEQTWLGGKQIYRKRG